MATALVAFSFVFFRGLDNGFVSDDWVFLYRASTVDSLSGVLGFLEFGTDWFVRPIQWLVTVALHRLVGLEPLGYHLTSTGIHLLNTALVFVLWRNVFHREWTRGQSNLMALGTALFFAFHRRHHEVVFWYSAISESLAASFRLTTLFLLWRCFDQDDRPRWHLAVASFGTATLALLSKESSVVLPVEAAFLLAAEFMTRPPNRTSSLRARWVAWAGIATLTGLWVALYITSVQRGAEAALVRSDLTLLRAEPVEWLFRFEHAFVRCYRATSLPGHPRLLSLLAILGMAAVALAVFRRRFVPILAGLLVVVSLAPYVATTALQDIALGVPPLLRETGIGEDRYYYSPSIAAGALVLAIAGWLVAEGRRLIAGRAGAVVWALPFAAPLLFGLVGARALIYAERDWDYAGHLAARVVATTKAAVPRLSPNSVLCLENVPDNHNGKFVLRNGSKEALYLAYKRSDFGIAINEQRNGLGCTFALALDPISGPAER